MKPRTIGRALGAAAAPSLWLPDSRLLRVTERTGKCGRRRRTRICGTDDGYLFSRNGKRVTYGMQHERFTRSARKAGLAGLSEHGLRHLYVSTLLHGGVQIHEVAHWVGHRDINVTHAVYGHLLPDAWTRGREALELAY